MNARQELNDRVGAVEFVRTDVYLIKIWQMALFLTGGAVIIALMIASLFTGSTTRAALIICAAAVAIGTVVFYAVLKFRAPINYTDYYCREGGDRHVLRCFGRNFGCYYLNGKGFSAASNKPQDGCDPYVAYSVPSILSADYTEKKEAGTVTTFYGKTDDGRKAKAQLRDGKLTYAAIGGVRIRIFDINDRAQTAAAPYAVAQYAQQKNIRLPKYSAEKTSNA